MQGTQEIIHLYILNNAQKNKNQSAILNKINKNLILKNIYHDGKLSKNQVLVNYFIQEYVDHRLEK